MSSKRDFLNKHSYGKHQKCSHHGPEINHQMTCLEGHSFKKDVM